MKAIGQHFSRGSVAQRRELDLDRARKLQNQGKFSEAKAIYEQHLKHEPDDYRLNLNIGLCNYGLQRFAESSMIFHKMHAADPENDELIKFCGISYLANGNFNVALQFLRRYVKLHPEDYETWMNLASASGNSQNNTEALLYSTQALSLRPLDPRSHLNLGAALIPLHRYEDAITSFETTLMLDPNNVKAMMNCGTAYDLLEHPEISLEMFERCLPLVESDPQQLAELQYKMSFPLLKTGNLEKGWKFYDAGFIPADTRSRFPKRSFCVPRWDGSVITGKRLLIWREQGIGDEIRFAGLIPDLEDYCDKVIIECEPRLETIFRRSFPKCKVRSQGQIDGALHHAVHGDYDYHLPMGSLMRYLRPTIEAFRNPHAYLIPDPERMQDIRRRLEPIRDGKSLVGICWRSGFLTTERNLNYTAISDWAPILRNRNLVFVNLQYGDTTAEVRKVLDEFGVTIHQWNDIDLKNDQEALAALIANMDCVVSAVTAVANMAEALNVRSKLFMPYVEWTFLGQKTYPWAKNSEYFFPDHSREGVATTIPHIAASLAEEFGQS